MEGLVIKFKNGSSVSNNPKDVIRGKRADNSHWMYDCEACGISKEDFEEAVKPFVLVNDKTDSNENKWLKLLCWYHTKTELYDRRLSRLRSPHDPTEAWLYPEEVRQEANNYARSLRLRIKEVAAELRIPESIVRYYTPNINYSAQHWIDLYNHFVEHGEMDFLKKYLDL